MKNRCGQRPLQLTHAVSGSGSVDTPWAVSLSKVSFGHHCTGTILSPMMILTAAHCVTGESFKRDQYKILAGVSDLQELGGQTKSISKVDFHSKWRARGEHVIYFDVALIYLETKLTFSPTVQPICLPTQTNPVLPESMVGDAVTTVGWGRDNKDDFGKNITAVDVTIRASDECNYKYNNTNRRRDRLAVKVQLPSLLIRSQYCADNNINEDVGTCHGDSGGPSFIRYTWIE